MNFLGKRRNFVAGCCELVKNVTIIQYFYFTGWRWAEKEIYSVGNHPVNFFKIL